MYLNKLLSTGYFSVGITVLAFFEEEFESESGICV